MIGTSEYILQIDNRQKKFSYEFSGPIRQITDPA
jgi:hypothetical protein